jgi:hypothetical protein
MNTTFARTAIAAGAVVAVLAGGTAYAGCDPISESIDDVHYQVEEAWHEVDPT